MVINTTPTIRIRQNIMAEYESVTITIRGAMRGTVTKTNPDNVDGVFFVNLTQADTVTIGKGIANFEVQYFYFDGTTNIEINGKFYVHDSFSTGVAYGDGGIYGGPVYSATVVADTVETHGIDGDTLTPVVTVESDDDGSTVTYAWTSAKGWAVPDPVVYYIANGQVDYTIVQGYAKDAQQSAEDASDSETVAAQALSDLLAMINSGDIPLLVGGKLPLTYIPATATTEVYVVTSEDDLTSLVAQRGDMAQMVETVNGVSTITKSWQLLGDDATVADDWIVWGTSYAVRSAYADTAEEANNANMINNKRIVSMTSDQYDTSVLDDDTFYFVYDEEEETDD